MWDSSLVLVDFLFRNAGTVRGRQVIELGSGTGVAGIAVATLGCSEMILTDLEVTACVARVG
jgi:predicted nicotinamide N-methyase